MTVSIPAGQLDQRLTLLAPTVAEDAHGQRVETFAAAGTVWAAVLSVRMQDQQAAQALNAVAEQRFRIRYRADVLGTWRVQWRGTTFEVLGMPIDVQGARTALDLVCRSLPA